MAREFELIRKYFAESKHQFQRSEVVLGIGDDGAVLDFPSDKQLCVSTDSLVSGVHFPAQASPALIAKKSLAVNLSDMAAMGAVPLAFTLNLVLESAEEGWLAEFSESLLTLAQQYHCPLIGGDTSQGPLAISIQIQGLVAKNCLISRQGAKPGDKIYVSGYLGDAALALPALGLPSHLEADIELLHSELPPECMDHLQSAYYEPQPRIELAQLCAPFVSSGLDISDGLVGDLGHILKASSVGAVVDIEALPYSDSAMCCASKSVRQIAALFGGDDYELCLTVPPEHLARFESLAAESSTAVTCIGEITEGSELEIIDASGDPVNFAGAAYAHFQ